MAIVDILPHTFTGYTLGGMTISRSSDAGYPGWKPADGNVADGNGWLCTVIPAWWKIDLGAGASYLLDNYSIRVMQYANVGPETWTLSGSNDDSTYDVIDSRALITWAARETKNWTCATRTTGYRYFKFDISAVTTWATICELYLFGEEPLQHYTFALEPGVFSVAGTPVSLLHNKRLIASPGAFTMIGENMGMPKALTPFSLEPGAFAMTGAALSIRRPASYMRMDPGVFAMSGMPIDVKYHWYSGDANANYQFRKQRRKF